MLPPHASLGSGPYIEDSSYGGGAIRREDWADAFPDEIFYFHLDCAKEALESEELRGATRQRLSPEQTALVTAALASQEGPEEKVTPSLLFVLT